MVMRLSTLEGRQRALQGKMAKLDGAWGGDASQMSLAIAELQHVVANGNPHHAEFGSLRGQLIALAHSIDKLDKRTSSIERRLTAPPGTPQHTSPLHHPQQTPHPPGSSASSSANTALADPAGNPGGGGGGAPPGGGRGHGGHTVIVDGLPQPKGGAPSGTNNNNSNNKHHHPPYHHH
mmetsp:Transcript_7942/g.26069  ORF Transcript_7942/g.26069 Transcript_7942/m.26069 type:complete len:178 (+) Transcript_7942:872-1405(+)